MFQLPVAVAALWRVPHGQSHKDQLFSPRALFTLPLLSAGGLVLVSFTDSVFFGILYDTCHELSSKVLNFDFPHAHGITPITLA